MNEIDTSTLDGKIAVLTAFKEGKKVQFKSRPCATLTIPWTDAFEDCLWNWVDFDYRIKPLEFPKLPDHLQWHNPDNLTPEQVGDRKRLAVMGEALPSLYDYWDSESGYWVTSGALQNVNVTVFGKTFRLPISTPFPEPPKPKVMVPLGPDDCPPGTVFRSSRCSCGWFAPQSIECDGVSFISPDGDKCVFENRSWEQLKEAYYFKRPGQDWQPCEKESAS